MESSRWLSQVVLHAALALPHAQVADAALARYQQGRHDDGDGCRYAATPTEPAAAAMTVSLDEMLVRR